MSTLNVNVQYRPMRIGWCIRNNNLNDYKKALQLSHTLWGGRYNPLIPVENFDLASELIEFFKVDILFPISDDDSIVEFTNKFPHLPWPHSFNNKDLFIKWIKKREPAFLDILQAASRLSTDLKKENDPSKLQLSLISWNDTDSLANVFNAMFGSLPMKNELDIDFDYNKLLTKTLTTNHVPIISTNPVDSGLLQLFTINDLTTHALQGQSSKGWNIPGFYIGGINNFTDLVNFWNLRACGIPLLYYDPMVKDRLTPLKSIPYAISYSKNCNWISKFCFIERVII